MDLHNKLKHVKQASKSKDGKVLIQNMTYLSVLKLASYLFPLITVPYLARVIGASGYGKIAFASAVIVWIQTVVNWGFNLTATRDVAKNRDNLDKVSEIFSNVLWSRVFLMCLSALVLFVLVLVVPKFREDWMVLLFTFLLIPGHIMFPEWFFQAMEKMKFTTILNIVSKLVFTGAIFVVIRDSGDYLYHPLCISLGYLVSGIVTFYLIVKKWHVRILRVQFKTIIQTIKSSSDVFLNNLFPNFYNSLSSVILGFVSGSVANGILDAGGKFVTLSRELLGVISAAFFPFLSRRIEKHYVLERANMTLAILIAIALFFSAPLLIKWFYTPEFCGAVPVLRIMCLSLVFLTMNNVYGVNFMIIKGYERELRRITMWSSIGGFLIAYPLIYYFSYIGAALTVTLSRAMIGFGAMWYSKRKIKHQN